MKYTEKCGGIIDVTKPPYNLDNTGKEDCTQVLVKLLDDILQKNIEGLMQSKAKLDGVPGENARISFEIWRMDGNDYVIFPEYLEPTNIIYFPNGTYLVSDTVSYTLENLKNIYANLPTNEMNRQIHFLGESRDGVTIKLKDNCKGFEFGNNRPVISFMRAETTNIAMQNFFENITIDIGSGNPGATGLVFYCNNTGAVRNVKIVSSDPEKRGYAGLSIPNEKISGCYIKDVEVEGFDYGVHILPTRNFAVCEHITVKNQRVTGFYIDSTILSIHDLVSENFVSGMRVMGTQAHVTLIDGKFTGGYELTPAVDVQFGNVLVRNISSQGYNCAVTVGKNPVVDGKLVTMDYAFSLSEDKTDYIDEYCTGEVFTAFPCEEKTLNLPIEDAPEITYSTDAEEWAYVTDFGADNTAEKDATEAIQNAMNSGKKYVCFAPGTYLVDGTITIPAGVEVVDFRFCNLKAGDALKEMKEGSNFRIAGESDKPILIQNIFTWEQYFGWFHFLEQASKRTLIMKDLHTQTAALYFNSVPGGKVYIEDCACTMGSYEYASVSPFEFHGQTVWARQINPERSFCQMLNDGSKVWIMGFKAEGPGIMFKTINGGSTEICGGNVHIGQGKPMPIIYNDNCNVSARFATSGLTFQNRFPNVVTEIRGEEEITLKEEQFPIRALKCIEVPLYVGKK